MGKSISKKKAIAAIIIGFVLMGASELARSFAVGSGFSLNVAAIVGGIVVVWGLLGIWNTVLAMVVRRLIVACLCLLLVSLLIVEVLIIAHARPQEAPETDFVIVLGAGVNGETPSLMLVTRLRKTLEYLEKYPEAGAILSGGQGAGEDVTEAYAMKKWLVERGIPPERLFEEDQSKNTDENFRNSLRLLEEMGEEGRPVAVITNDFHLFRASRLAKRYGLETVAISAPTPDLGIIKPNYYFREYFSVMVFFFRGFIGR